MTIIKKTYGPSLHIMVKQLSNLILNTKKKKKKLQTFAHKDLLTIYENHKNSQKDSKSTIDLPLCADNKHLH